jgi:hypothetical protein
MGLHRRLVFPEYEIAVFGKGDFSVLVDSGRHDLALHDLQQFVGQVLAFERLQRAALNAVLVDRQVGSGACKKPHLELMLQQVDVDAVFADEVFNHAGVRFDEVGFHLLFEGACGEVALDPQAHGVGRGDTPASVTGRARACEALGNRFARALARQLHQPQRADAPDAEPCAVALERALQRLHHLPMVALAPHVDEVHHDNPADVAQTQLATHLLHCFEVRLQDGLRQRGLARELARVHIDGGERFGLVDGDVAARLEPHLATQQALHLLLDVELLKHRGRLVVEHHARAQRRRDHLQHFVNLLVLFGVVDPQAVYFGGEHIAQHAVEQARIAMHERGRVRLRDVFPNLLPELG